MRARFAGQKFSAETFREAVNGAAGRAGAFELPPQGEYLIRYLRHRELSARWMIVEAPYVDRHFLEEFTGYYASSLRPPTSVATRIHFFTTEVNLLRSLEAAARGRYDIARDDLQTKYLGFTVVRPIPSCPIGRTVLEPYPPNERHYARQKHHVHLAGIHLTIEGVPFQQQDQAVGACATTAVWSALAQVSRVDGMRGPTPFAITKAATRQLVRNRTFPAADGLSLEQIAGAVRDWGYSPHCLASHDADPEFQLAVKCYLRSGIPVILITAGDPGHAYTAVGFRERDDDGEAPPDIVIGDEAGKHTRARGMSRLYVHDDRHGPYVRMEWRGPDRHLYARLQVKPTMGQPDLPAENIRLGIAPLYPKLRLSARDLITCASEFWPAVRHEVGAENHANLRVDLRFALGGEYLRHLLRGATGLPRRLAGFARSIHLPRYVGIATFRVDERLVVDALFDSTDINRDHPPYSSLIGIVSYAGKLRDNFRKFAQQNAPGRVVVA